MTADSPRPADTAAIHAWLVEVGLARAPMAAVLDEFCRRLNDAGFAIARGFASIATLHPLLRARSATWERGGVTESGFQHSDLDRASWHESPLKHMLDSGSEIMSRRLTGPGARLDFPVLREFRDAGHTEWIGLRFGFGWNFDTQPDSWLGLICSWATDGAGGWTDARRAALVDISRSLALALKGSSSYGLTRDLLATYLGDDAGERVAAGQVRRGTVGDVDACLLISDLRGFTTFADTSPPEAVAARLNAYLDCMGAPVEERGGTILKFLGDGLLAAFLAGEAADGSAVCASALDAARDILGRVADLNADAAARGEPALAVDIGLHRGTVLYGNVGTARRLDFTVIGPAVNEAARLEALCRDLGTNLLVSASFRAAAGAAGDGLVSLGPQRLRGVREPREVFTVP